MSGGRAVVIGSGMGGLVAALLLQRRGMHVTVVEQHYRPGGLLHRFFRGRSAFDTGFHYMGGVAPGQPLGQVLRHVGVFDKLKVHALDPDGFDVLRFPDLHFRVPVGWLAYERRLVDAFPHERAGIREVCAAMRAATEAYGLYHLRVDADLAALLDAESRSVAAVVAAAVRDPRCRAVLSGQSVLYGVRPTEAPFGVHALVTDHFLSGAYTVAGGGDALALAMVRRLRAGGGTLRLRARAEAIEVEGGAATGVIVNGERLAADVVVSNLHPRGTLALLPDGAVRPAFRTRVTGQEVGVGYFGVYLTVDGPVPEIGNANAYCHPSWDADAVWRPIDVDGHGVFFASAPSEQHPHRAPVVLMVFPVEHARFADWADTPTEDRPAGYAALKAELLGVALEALVREFGSLRGRVVRAEASTPLTTEHYTGSPLGAMYGHRHSVAQMGRSRPPSRTRVQNLLMVGQGVSTPGVLGAALSAYYAVGHLTGMDSLVAELRSA